MLIIYYFFYGNIVPSTKQNNCCFKTTTSKNGKIFPRSFHFFLFMSKSSYIRIKINILHCFVELVDSGIK